MRNTFYFIFILICSANVFGQSYVKVTHKQADTLVYLTAENITKEDWVYSFKLTLENLWIESYDNQFELKAGEKIEFATLKLINPTAEWKYNFNYWHTPVVEGGAMGAIAKKLSISVDEAKNSIIIFDKEGCTRCDRTLNYLRSEGISHKILNISKDRRNSRLMFDLIQNMGINITTVTTPMIVMGGKAYYNIGNLESFLIELKAFSHKKGLPR